jgi:hypothetical protein
MRQVLRRIALTLAGLLAFSGIWLTWIATEPPLPHRLITCFRRAAPAGAGRIITADVSAATDADGGRTYPEGPTYAHLIGYTAPPGDAASRNPATPTCGCAATTRSPIGCWGSAEAMGVNPTT